MLQLSQRDPRWGEDFIGKSDVKIKAKGCTITSISMFSDWYGKFRNPEWIASNLSFTLSGKLIWNSLDASELPMKFVYRYYSRKDDIIQSILRSKDSVCLLEVDSNHWVALVGYSRLFGYRVNDPYYGDTIYLSKRNYNITGFAQLTRKI